MKTFAILIAVVAVVCYMDTQQTKHAQKITKQEIATLQQIKKTVMEKYIPDSLNNKAMRASHDVMYLDTNSNDYWAARKTLQQVEEYTKKCKPCMEIERQIQEKKNDLVKLEYE